MQSYLLHCGHSTVHAMPYLLMHVILYLSLHVMPYLLLHVMAYLLLHVQVRAGTGGDEAALFAGDLLRMYERAAALNGWKFEVRHFHSSQLLQ